MGLSPFQIEAWAEYGVGTVIILLRIVARCKKLGYRGWQGDDYFNILVLICWTIETTMLHLISNYGSNTGWSDDQRAAFGPEQIASFEIGSKLLISGWFVYTMLIWSLKACMLFYYSRITDGLYQKKIVKACSLLCVASYIALIFAIFFHCRPFHANWQVNPDPGIQCTAHNALYLVYSIPNVITDAILIMIPIPLLLKARIRIAQKIIIGVLLCSGVFIIVATLLRCILSLKDIKNLSISTIWGIREPFVAIFVVNAPCIKPLFSGFCGGIFSKYASQPDYDGQASYGLPNLSHKRNKISHLNYSKCGDDHESQEIIITTQTRNPKSESDPEELSFESGRGIHVTTTYQVTNNK